MNSLPRCRVRLSGALFPPLTRPNSVYHFSHPQSSWRRSSVSLNATLLLAVPAVYSDRLGSYPPTLPNYLASTLFSSSRSVSTRSRSTKTISVEKNDSSLRRSSAAASGLWRPTSTNAFNHERCTSRTERSITIVLLFRSPQITSGCYTIYNLMFPRSDKISVRHV